jgi:predicted PurR-regulated permease PerM
MAGSLLSIFTSLILMLVYVYLLLFYRTHIKKFLLKLSPPGRQSEFEQIILDATNVSQQYLLGLAKMIFCLWILYAYIL